MTNIPEYTMSYWVASEDKPNDLVTTEANVLLPKELCEVLNSENNGRRFYTFVTSFGDEIIVPSGNIIGFEKVI